MEQTDWHRVAEERFALHIAQELSGWASAGQFRHILIIADPRTLGALRQAYDAPLRSMIVAEIDKDLTKLPIDKIEAAITALSVASS
jgi:protein required for attachment to host cells